MATRSSDSDSKEVPMPSSRHKHEATPDSCNLTSLSPKPTQDTKSQVESTAQVVRVKYHDPATVVERNHELPAPRKVTETAASPMLASWIAQDQSSAPYDAIMAIRPNQPNLPEASKYGIATSSIAANDGSNASRTSAEEFGRNMTEIDD